MPPHIIYALVFSISSVLDYVPCIFLFTGHMEALRALDACASNEAHQYGRLGVHAITIRARNLNRLLSNTFDDSPRDTWMHREDPIKIRQARST